MPYASGETDLCALEVVAMHAARSGMPVLAEMPGFTSRIAHWGELDAAVETLAGGRDSTEVFGRAFTDGRCPVPHWGYMIKGRMRVRYADHEEVISAGDLWYMPPGHIPSTEEDVENIVFTAAGEYERVMGLIGRAAAASPHRGE